jgi:hypothetical protein
MALPRIGVGLGQVSEVQSREWGGHTAAQTMSAIVMALAAVFAVIFQSKGDPKFAWSLVALIALVLLASALMYTNRVLAFFKVRRLLAARNRMVREQSPELLRLARSFAQFANSGDWSNLRYIVFNAYGNNPDKCATLCPPDYMRDLCQFFLQHLETRPPENEGQFLLAIQEWYGIVASYNNNYVLEPLRKMRLKQWSPAGNVSELVPDAVTWVESLPVNHQGIVGRQIEDFRERWAGFLDDMKKWLEKTSDAFGTPLPTYFERPQKL